MRTLTLNALLAGARPDDYPIAFLAGHPMTIARWRADIAHNAARLSAAGIGRGALVCTEAYWFTVGLLALIASGARVVLPPNQQPGTLRDLQPEFDALVTDSISDPVINYFRLESGVDDRATRPCDFAQHAIGFFTSGSTGEIKLVPKTLRHFEREAAALEARFGAELGAVRVFGTVTHQHVFGMTFRLMWPLLAGRPFQSEFHVAWESLLDGLTPRAVIVSSPAQLSRLGGLTALLPAQQPSMVITAGAPLPQSAADEARAIFGCTPTEIYGSTEAGVIGWREGTAQPAAWRPFAGVEVQSGTDGILLLRSQHASTAGWCEQADRISMTGDGRFRLEGRVDRIVKIEGKRVSLQRLEQAVNALRWIEQAAVVTLGEDPIYLGVVAQLTAVGQTDLTLLGKFRFARMLRRELADCEDAAVLPRRWRFVEAIPLDGLGKRRLHDLRALFGKSV